MLRRNTVEDEQKGGIFEWRRLSKRKKKTEKSYSEYVNKRLLNAGKKRKAMNIYMQQNKIPKNNINLKK